MTFKTLATAACIALSSATASLAAPINLDFTVGGVSGTFYGLDDEIFFYSQAASSFDLTTPNSIWTGVSTTGAYFNNFVFLSSGLGSFDFLISDQGIVDYSTTYLELVAFDVYDLDRGEGRQYLEVAEGGEEYTVWGYDVALENFTISPISPVPSPAGGLLLLSGLAGVVALKRRKKRTA
jgi:hypothetical protein